MNRTRNSCIALSLVVLVTSCGGSGKYVERGDAAFAKKDFKAALVEYRTAVSKDPTSGLARQKLARTLQELGALDTSWREFVRAADLLPDDETAQLEAGEALLQTGQFQDARTRAERVIRKNPANVRAHLLRGLATAGMNDLDSAVKDVEKALELDPSRAMNYANLGALELARGNAEVAEAALKQAANLAGNATKPHIALGTFYWRTGRRAEAEAALKAAVARRPTDILANRTLAMFYIVTGRAADAEAPLKAAATNADALESQLALADYYTVRNRAQDAIPILNRLTQRREARAAASARLAGIDYVQGRRDAAYAKLEALLKQQPNNVPVLVLKSRWLINEGRKDEALATAKAAVAAGPKSVEAYYLLGDVHRVRYEVAPAISAYNEVLRLNPRLAPAQLQLANLNMAAGKPKAAEDLAASALRANPKSENARLALVQALRRQGHFAEAADELKPLLQAFPKAAPVHAEAGEIALGRKDFGKAAAEFDEALRLDPNSYDALVGRVTLDVTQHKNADAIRRIEAALSGSQGNTGPVLALAGRTFAMVGDLRRAEAVLEKALAVDPGFMPSYHYLGQVYIRERRVEEALKRYEAAAARQRDNIGAHTMAAMLLQALNRNAEAKARYQTILQIDPRAVVAANNLAYMNAEAGTELDIALQLAQTAKAAFPDEPNIDDTLGWVYYKKDMAALAIDPLRRSVERVPTNPLYCYHLGMAYLKGGDKQRAREMLQQALKLDQRFQGADDARRTLESLGS